MEKCYNITVTGKVHDVGFRAIAEYAGRLLDISGLVYNLKNGSVKIICGGNDSSIRKFLQQIRSRGEERGAVITDIRKLGISSDIIDVKDLPYPFSRVLADEDIDLGRKLDKGNELLTDIKRDTSALQEIRIDTLALPDIKRDTSALPEIKRDISVLSSFVAEQRIHNQHLEKILEKLVEKAK